MIPLHAGYVELLFGWLSSLLKSRRRLQAENLVLHHQVNILRRPAPRRIRLSNLDRTVFVVFVWLYGLTVNESERPGLIDMGKGHFVRASKALVAA
jgi:hypothetical protein